jgi:hypothetical protein
MQITYKIELKVDFDASDEPKKEAIRSALKEAARTAYAVAVLISGKRRPEVAVFADNFFDGTETIDPFDGDAP